MGSYGYNNVTADFVPTILKITSGLVLSPLTLMWLEEDFRLKTALLSGGPKSRAILFGLCVYPFIATLPFPYALSVMVLIALTYYYLVASIFKKSKSIKE